MLVSTELVEVKPLGLPEPSGILYYIDFVYETPQDPRLLLMF